VPSVTADSNIWVSAFGYGGNPRRLIEMADAGEIRIDISEFIIDEVLRTLRDKFEWSAERLQEAVDQMTVIATKVAPSRTVDVLKEDPSDNRILECAAQAKSDYLVTGDTGLLSLGNFENIPIVKVADFLQIVSRQGKGRAP
jgi:putative PIN family toxin of toxin-antitoxin system